MLCLQETHLTNNNIIILKRKWYVHFVIPGEETNAEGVFITFENIFLYTILGKTSSTDGRFIIIDLEIPEVVVLLLI